MSTRREFIQSVPAASAFAVAGNLVLEANPARAPLKGHFDPKGVESSNRAAVQESAYDVVDGARSRHRSAIGWFVGDESHEGSRPHANYHDRFGYRQERVSDSRH